MSEKNSKQKVKIRRWKPADIEPLVSCYKRCYPEFEANPLADARHYRLELAAFPEGQFLAEVSGEVVGYASSLIVQLDEESVNLTYDEITGSNSFNTHTPGGDTLYGADIAILPAFRGRGIAGRLYKARKKLVRRYNLRRMIAYGRLPGYRKHREIKPQEYVAKVKAGELQDSSLSAHLKNGYVVKDIVLGFFDDRASLDHATLLEWENPDHDPGKRLVAAASLGGVNRKVRVATAQFLMRTDRNMERIRKYGPLLCRFGGCLSLSLFAPA